MFAIRRAADRGHANHGWLDSHHTFSLTTRSERKPRWRGSWYSANEMV
ncbi:MAG: quercetin 2,3-dioxygenase, partial [Planctomycetota bacterium]